MLDVLQPLGFERILLAELSTADQIQAFSEAEVIVGPHGAGLSNLVFSTRETRVFEFFAPTYHFPRCYGGLAELCGHRYFELIGEGAPKTFTIHGRRDNIAVDLTELRAVLTRMEL